LDVATVLAQVRGDAVGARCFTDFRAGDRVGHDAAPRLAQCGDVVDVDVQALPRH
jgi:hypothetical protein